ncbi:MAG: hypothetical protein EZS28_021359 [Streblomastix strix]|uniref:Uncharacterized protein n=1 Tax=Streblomastix strix TaxID=222440 RepID=A0A5J4VKJ2_9EUKA|nr:MAG: hypothetical protein EZS28_021359 [Streblomastix strix]
MGRSHIVWLIANSQPGQPTALLPLPSAPPASTASSIDDSDQDFHAQQKKKRKRTESPILSHRAALVAQGPVDIIRIILEGANAGDIMCQPRIQVSLVALDRHQETSTIIDSTTTSTSVQLANFEGKWPKQDSWGSSAEQNRRRYENLWSTSEPAEIQPSESLHVRTSRVRAVSFAESALIAEIHNIIRYQPPTKYRIDAYLMCLTTGAHLRSICFAYSTQGQSKNYASAYNRSAPVQFLPPRDNAPNCLGLNIC